MAVTSPQRGTAGEARSGRWIDDGRPEDPEFWESSGRGVARRNLFSSVFSEHIGSSIWSPWSVLVLSLAPAGGTGRRVRGGR